MSAWRKTLPLWISIGLIAWLIHRVSLDDLLRAADTLPWQLLLPMTVGLVVAQYLWDVLCLLTVFADVGTPLRYWQMLRLRGRSYVVAAMNQGLGQAALAWEVARIEGIPFIAALSRTAVLGWHEGVLLAAVALAGSWWADNPAATQLRYVSAVFLAFLLAAALVLGVLPAAWRRRAERTKWGAWLGHWTWRRSMCLILLRVVYFAVVGVYVATALQVCGVQIGPATVAATIPLVLMASALPSASGLGTRETAMCLLLQPAPTDVLLALGLIWSTGVIVVRLAIGLAWLWLGERPETRFAKVSP